ncbi:hypothetical protein [Phenylobacterium sp.]|jgi:hypothetical protein|uniref:hypothetical protein n=1 Tax=Phenylobacterium sp. TaxID=1871053 RepID=UPI0037847D84
MRFYRTIAPDCDRAECIVASGVIGPDTAREFRAFLKREAILPGASVVFDSKGGNLAQGLKLGLHIRRAGFSTTIQRYDQSRGVFVRGGECASACAYAFLGGTRRTVPAGSRVGVHQFSITTTPIAWNGASEIQTTTATVISYLNLVGASPQLAASALKTPPDRVLWLSARELSRLHVVTGEGETTAASRRLKGDVRDGLRSGSAGALAEEHVYASTASSGGGGR